MLRRLRRLRALGPAALLLVPLACESSDPEARNPVGDGGNGDVACFADEGIVPVANTGCAAQADDYTPRVSASSTDTWPACISDDNQYHVVDANIGALSRVAAFEQIAALLGFGGSKVPTPQDFLDARVLYTQTEGIESRVVRREDEHYPAAATACRDMTPTEQAQHPERCVGPVKILPILNQAFEGGVSGEDPVGNASRIEGALLWFFYISSFKEATSAASAAKDCDSMWAKYTGGEPREGAAGLSRWIVARSPETHDAIWDGLLAVRCWRDLDNPTGAATDLALRDRARAQLDRAYLRGLALIVRQRVQALPCNGAWQSTRILGGVLDREATLRDPTHAATLRTELARSDDADVDQAAVVAALDALFACP